MPVAEKNPQRKLIAWSSDEDGFYHRTSNFKNNAANHLRSGYDRYEPQVIPSGNGLVVVIKSPIGPCIYYEI
jgi:hypothetical protein